MPDTIKPWSATSILSQSNSAGTAPSRQEAQALEIQVGLRISGSDQEPLEPRQKSRGLLTYRLGPRNMVTCRMNALANALNQCLCGPDLEQIQEPGLELIQVRKLYSRLNIEFIASQQNSTGEFYDVQRIY
jgi:hypothetical protein